MKYKYFLFDWDGSLANTLPDWFRVHKKILLQNGIKVTDEMVYQEAFGRIDVRELGITDEETFFANIESEILPSLETAVLNPEVIEVLEMIKSKGGKVGVMTDSKKKWVKHALRNNNLKSLVDVFLAREDVTYRKPDPEVVLKSLRYMGGNVNDTLVTGDNWRDIQSAKAAGADSCLYFPKRYNEFYNETNQKKLGATYIISDFGELKKMIE